MFQIRPLVFTTATIGVVTIVLLADDVLSQSQVPRETLQQHKDVKEEKSGGQRHQAGNAEAGREVFRFETFGNEGFWTDAIQLPKGMENEKFTPRQALEAGLHVDADAVPADLKKALAVELKTDLSPENAPLLNDPKTTMRLVKANAVIGVVPRGDKVGISCAICHTITDNSIFEMPGKGSVGRRLDGRATHSLDMGSLLALAANSRAYYPNLQLELGGKTVGRAPKGIRVDSTEAEVDAYLKNPDFYPRGTFDETQDGIGNPVQNTPLFRQDLAGPYGSNGLHEILHGISNASYTTNLDPTTAATPEGKQNLALMGGKAGEELHKNYLRVLKGTGVTGHPFVNAEKDGKPGHRDTPVGRQVNKQKLLDMSAYLKNLPAPAGVTGDARAIDRGRIAFQANCTQCHNADPGAPVSNRVLPLKEVWPGYAPVLVENRKPPLSPIENSPGGFDDKMAVVDASERGEKRGVALPLLLDLARKPAFLHDNSVPSLETLLAPQRGDKAPHPFYLKDKDQRADVVTFLKALGPNLAGHTKQGNAIDTPIK
ncbi:MAG: hypothetical protein M3Q16_03240 [Pseudomonadota bacterium]|nr:hypothetical protein [Pseudomonadota bacterium]